MIRCYNLLHVKHVGIVFQRHRVNNDSTLTWSRDNWRLLSARLLWEFSRSRVASEVSHACCCGVCPFRALSLPLSLSRYLSPSVFSPTPFLSVSLALHLQSASVVSADCWTVGEEGYREYWSFGESLWKMAPVVTGWVWNSGLRSGVGGKRKLFLWNCEMLSHVLRPVFFTHWLSR